MKLTDITKSIQSGVHLLLVSGEEWFLKQNVVSHLKNTLLNSEMKDFNYSKYYGEETKLKDLIASCQTIPWNDAYRLVLLYNCDAMKESDQKNLMEQLKYIPAETIIIMEGKKFSVGVQKIFKQQKNALYIEFKKYYESKIRDWLVDRAFHSYKRKLTPEAAWWLTIIVGTDLSILDKALEKIDIYLPPQAYIDQAVVKKLCEISKTYSIFNLMDAIVERKAGFAITILNHLLQDGMQPLVIFTMLYKLVGQLYAVNEGIRLKLSESDMMRQSGIVSFNFTKYAKRASEISAVQFNNIMLLCMSCDLAYKSGWKKNSYYLERLVLELVFPELVFNSI